MIYQYAFNVKGIENLEDISDLTCFLSMDRKKKIEKYYFVKDKIRSVFAEVILKYALYERYNLDYRNIEIKHAKYGKPFLANNSGIFFNLSHSGNWVLCGVGDYKLGIDVQQVKDSTLMISKRFFSKEESEYIESQPVENRSKSFCKIWTLKESYVKCIGKGLGISFDTFNFRFIDEGIQLYLDNNLNQDFLFRTYSLDDEHLMALCVSANSKLDGIVNDSIKRLSLDELRKWKG